MAKKNKLRNATVFMTLMKMTIHGIHVSLQQYEQFEQQHHRSLEKKKKKWRNRSTQSSGMKSEELKI